MSMYYEGYKEAREAINKMSEKELLDYLDAMYGKDNLKDGYSLDDLRSEALSQCKREFTDTSSKEYEIVEFYTKLNKAMRNP